MSRSRRVRVSLALAALLALGCTRQSTEIKVRDPGRVQVALRSATRPLLLLPPDGGHGSIAIPDSGGRQPSITRSGDGIALRWRLPPSDVTLVDAAGTLPEVRTRAHTSGPFLYVEYDVGVERALAAESGERDALPLQLAIPLENVERAEHVSERRRWPGYVTVPLGGVFTLTGTVLITAVDDEYSDLAGVFYLTAGVSLLAWGIYVLLDSPDTTPIVSVAR